MRENSLFPAGHPFAQKLALPWFQVFSHNLPECLRLDHIVSGREEDFMRFNKQTGRDGAARIPHGETAKGKKEKIAELAEAELHHGPYRALRNVTCVCQEGTLILYGRVPSYHLKQIAQTAVATLPGVGRIDNRIDVAASHR
jgi:hypothetical protein